MLVDVIPAGHKAWEVVHRSLRSVPIMAELPPDELRRVAEALELVEYAREDVVVAEGANSDDGMYIIWEGTCRAEKAGEGIVVEQYKTLEHFGELARAQSLFTILS